MNYTVLGNSVNLAARLEGLNKEYGTTILVSEAVRNRVEHCFRFNSIASVIAKGMTTETRVYELVEAVAEDAARYPSPPDLVRGRLSRFAGPSLSPLARRGPG
jgi:class 3 adenylate cyclase